MPHVTALKVSHASLEFLLNALGVPGVPGAPGLNGDDDLSDDGMMPPPGRTRRHGRHGVVRLEGWRWAVDQAYGCSPELENLELRSCHSNQSHTPYAHGPGGVVTEVCVKKLVEVVGARNPVTGVMGRRWEPTADSYRDRGGARARRAVSSDSTFSIASRLGRTYMRG